MNKLATILLLFILSNSLYATDQQPDILIFEGKEYKIRVPGNDLPLASCPRQAEILKEMYKKPIPVLTSCWRLHYATYEIIDNILYLKSIKICHEDRSLNLKKIFGKDFTNKRVKVDWYTGELECGTHYHHIEAFRFKLGEFYEKLNYDNSKTKYSRFPWKFEAFIYENAKWEQLPKIEPNEIISVPVLIETNDTNEIINVSLKERGANLSVWEKEALKIFQLVPEWHTIYKKGKRIIQERNVVFRNEKYYLKRYGK